MHLELVKEKGIKRRVLPGPCHSFVDSYFGPASEHISLVIKKKIIEIT